MCGSVGMAMATGAQLKPVSRVRGAARRAPRSAAKRVAARAAAVAPAVDAQTVSDSINCIRFLAIDSINKSNSGHPGLPMGCAPMGYVIYREAMTHNPKNYKWFNRDRFVLSAGHGCMLQYSLMHLTGYPSVSVSHRTLSFCRTRAAYPIGRAHSPGKNQSVFILLFSGKIGLRAFRHVGVYPERAGDAGVRPGETRAHLNDGWYPTP